MDISLAPLGSGPEMLITAAVRDISTRKKIETDLQQAVAARDEMVGIISHELKNPLSAMTLGVTLLEKILLSNVSSGLPNAQMVRQTLGNLTTSMKRMKRLVFDLLDITRIEGARLSLDLTEEYFEPVLTEAVSLYQLDAATKKIRLSYLAASATESTEGFGRFYLDHDRVIQIVSNLIGNSIKFTPDGGEIVVAARDLERAIEIEVRDTGSGIAPDHLPHVFDRFWQAKDTAHKGTGLGLAIVKGLVEAHGGTVRVKSELGVGTSFIFTLSRELRPALDEAAVEKTKAA